MSENVLKLIPGGIAAFVLTLTGSVLVPSRVSAQASAPSIPVPTTSTSQPLTAVPSAMPMAQTPPEVQPLIIGGGDLLDVQVFLTPELSGRVRVDQYGNLSLPVGGSLHVAGMTAAEASRAIEGRLKATQIMLDPHVAIYVSEYTTQMVSVLGEVKRVGPVPLYGSQTLYDVLGAAGGFTTLAGGTISISHRDDPSPPEVIHVHTPNYAAIEHSTHVRPGDTIVVSQASIVYVLGAVNRQGSVPMPYGMPLSLLNVLSLSSGLSQIAKGAKAGIIRQDSAGKVTTIDVNIDDIMHHKAPDLMMQSSDMLVVPTSARKYYAQLILPSVATTAASAAITSILIR